MTRLVPTGGEPDEDEVLDRDPRKLAADVPRWSAGQPHYPDSDGDSVEFHDDGTPTRPARDYS